MVNHPDPDVNQALVRLCDALCSWERGTGRTSVLILKESASDFKFRAMSGKPVPNESTVSDSDLLNLEG